MRDAFAEDLVAGLTDCAGRTPDDPMAHLAADLLVATFSVAVVQAHHDARRAGDTERAQALFMATIDRGASALEAALAGTFYAGPAPGEGSSSTSPFRAENGCCRTMSRGQLAVVSQTN